MATMRERNDRKSGKKQGPKQRPEGQRERGWSPKPDSDSRPREPRRIDADHLIWGRHAVLAALANPARKGMGRLMVTADRATEIESGRLAPNGHKAEIQEARALDKLLPPGAAHQGFVFKVAPLDGVALEDIARPASGVIVMLDQITDPQNVGAIFRSALAFGARGIIVQDRHSPALAGPLAKASVGATERLPHARVTNLSRALEKLSDLGWRAVALDGATELTLEDALDGQPTVLVMGSEGDGVRRLVAEHCDAVARIPMPGGFESLNVSNAAAVALYEAARAQRRV
ncbi:23S rRNA (guanosine(2251)-2'-O)-methyltransferase RlmB [Brevundimonas aveniformis]|uniref:23S rRNA (guanosine(2251)-2'-O)-methyltransferase RlmB n=1 Tax=Brevundimonas aveniformis TaxID=370977 RepID=UPI002491C040|nr:23S rRNA (guanosine(2251)-2'-O)-methyltransferase RlmB [Brevundimonas aveniformis]